MDIVDALVRWGRSLNTRTRRFCNMLPKAPSLPSATAGGLGHTPSLGYRVEVVLSRDCVDMDKRSPGHPCMSSALLSTQSPRRKMDHHASFPSLPPALDTYKRGSAGIECVLFCSGHVHLAQINSHTHRLMVQGGGVLARSSSSIAAGRAFKAASGEGAPSGSVGMLNCLSVAGARWDCGGTAHLQRNVWGEILERLSDEARLRKASECWRAFEAASGKGAPSEQRRRARLRGGVGNDALARRRRGTVGGGARPTSR